MNTSHNHVQPFVTAVFLTFVALSATTTSADDKTNPPGSGSPMGNPAVVPAADGTAPQPAGGEQESLQETPAERNASEIAQQVNALIDAPVPVLASIARRLQAEVAAAIKYGGPIGVALEQERLLQSVRLDLTVAADNVSLQRLALTAALIKELDRVSQSGAAQAEIIRREGRLVRLFRPRVQELIRQEKLLRERAAETNGRLELVRQKRAELESEFKLAQRSLIAPTIELSPVVIPSLLPPEIDSLLASPAPPHEVKGEEAEAKSNGGESGSADRSIKSFIKEIREEARKQRR
jgi:hypothetical protein